MQMPKISSSIKCPQGPIREWDGKTLEIISMGNSGSYLVGTAELIGMKIIYPRKNYLEFPNQQFVDIAELATIVDVISQHCMHYEKNRKIKKK